LSDDFDKMDIFCNSQKYVIDKMQKDNMKYLYIYLRFFHSNPLRKVVLSKLTWNDLIIIKEVEQVILYTTKKTIFNEESSVYRLIVLDKIASNCIIRIVETLENKSVKIFNDAEECEKFVKKFQFEYLEGLKINSIKNLNKAYYIFYSSPLNTTLDFRTLQAVELTLKEIDILFPGTVPVLLMKKEEQRISETFNKRKNLVNDEVDISMYTDILDLEALVTILRYKKKITSTLIGEAILELKVYKQMHDSMHAQLIYDYIIYLLHRLKSSGSNKIKHKTFKNNVWILNNYIFRCIENLEEIRDYEISKITLRLENLKLNSQKTSIGILRRFFKYHELNSNFKINVDMVYYPKSMIFDFEIDKILLEIEKNYRQKNNLVKVGKNHKYNILAQQMIILFGYYFGLRRNEIRSRRKKDFIFHQNIFYVDINSLGFKKIQGLSMKTSSAKRRVGAIITHTDHLKIIDKFMQYSINFDSDSLLFRATTKDNRIASAVIKENVFDELNKIIKDITQRYCTLHSLRHSFATNIMMDIIEKKIKKPYEFFDELSIPIGHSLPEATTQSYIHWSLIPLLRKNH
jgi:integrase